MAKKVYAIKEGFNSATGEKIENKIVSTWAECLSLVKGVKGAKYKSFEALDDAKAYLNDTKKLLKKGVDSYPEELLHLYVDGSYNIESERFAYGLVAIRNNVVEYLEGGSGKDTSQRNIRQIAGELKGAIKAVEYALSLNEKKVVLFHDYEGIFHHATGSWDRKDESSINYYEEMNKLFSKGIEVIFVKVDSHTGDLYNELADEICKKELSIDSDNTVRKHLKANEILVLNNNIKSIIEDIIGVQNENLIICSEKQEKVNKVNFIEEIIRVCSDLSEEKQEKALKLIKDLAIIP